MTRYYLLIALIFFAFPSYSQAAEDEDEFVAFEEHVIQKGENLYSIAQAFDLGFDEILQANPDITNPRNIQAGKKIILPTTHLLPDVKREGIVLNLAELQIYFFLSENIVISFPISIGADEKTPVGKTKVADKREKPSWIPPASIRDEDPKLPEIVLPGPNNPLGNYALYLDASKNSKWQGIMIHGTNVPRSIGSKVSHGCIRLYPKDIQLLFENVEIGTPVEFVMQPVKVSEINNKIYLESHFKEALDLLPEEFGVKKLICKKVRDCETRVNWQKVDEVVMQNLGIPVFIGND